MWVWLHKLRLGKKWSGHGLTNWTGSDDPAYNYLRVMVMATPLCTVS